MKSGTGLAASVGAGLKPSRILENPFCYKKRVLGPSWVGLLLALAAVSGAFGSWSRAAAQDSADIEVITEPPPQPEPAPSSPPPDALPSEQPPPQPEKPKQPPGRLRVGGGIGFGFATGLISIGIAPQVSYIFKQIVEPGVSFRYEYTRDRIAVPERTWHTYGGSLFVRIFPIKQLFFLVEGEIINTGWKQGGFTSGRRNYGNLLLGGGLVMGVGKGVFIATSLKIAVFRNEFYPDAFPIISVGGGYAF